MPAPIKRLQPQPMHQQGFTLLELLIAVAIFALIGLAGYRLLNSVIGGYEYTRERSLSFSALHKAVTIIEQDLRQLSQRPVRDELGSMTPALAAQYRGGLPLEFTRSAGWNPQLSAEDDAARQTGSVQNADTVPAQGVKQRIAYRIENQQLQRLVWPVLDRAPDSEPRVQILLEDVSGLQIALLGDAGQWQAFWPVEDAQGQIDFRALPRGIRIAFRHTKYGRIERVFAREGL